MGHLLTLSTQMMCPHGGNAKATTSNARVKAGGDFLLRSVDTFSIAGCTFVAGVSPHPCVTVNWVQPALKSRAISGSTLTEESVGLCVAADQAVQGTVQVVFTQQRAAGQ
jgi:hypothetical protein